MASDGGDGGGDPPDGDATPIDAFVESDPAARTNPVIDSLAAGLASPDAEMAARCGMGLALLATKRPRKVSTVIGRLVPMLVDSPQSSPILRTLGTLVADHGREIRGALITATGYTNARRLYGRLEHTEGWDLADVAVEDFVDEAEPSFLSAMMRLIELEAEGRDPLDSDAWTLFIQRLPGEGGESASEEAIEDAAARQDSRPRSVRRRDRALQRIANSRAFRTIEANSRFDELEVLSRVRERRFAGEIRTRGAIGAREYAIGLRLCHRIDDPEFRRLLADRLQDWERVDGEGIVSVLDWGDTPRPWIATEVVETTLAEQEGLSTVEGLEHARSLTRSLVDLHRRGVVHGGIDPGSVGYPPNTLDGVVEPMLDHVGLLSVYRQFSDPGRYLDGRYGAPEWFDDRFGRIDRSTDIYQLGAVLYLALTGRPPFEESEDGLPGALRREQPTPPTELDPDLPPQVDEIIAKATAKQKLLRYETALGFHHEVRAVCDDIL